jgi:hypothetical protein
VAPTGDLPTGKSAAAATLSMAKNEAITITMIFMMLSPCVEHPDGPTE